MDYPPIRPDHLKQIRQLNELFLDLVSKARGPANAGEVPERIRSLLAASDTAQRQALTTLPRALFRFRLGPDNAAGAPSATPSAAQRAFNLTALLVAANMVRDSEFAARVLFAGSSRALEALRGFRLSDLIDCSTRPGLIACPLLEREPGTRVLSRARGAARCLSRDALIALAQSPCPRKPWRRAAPPTAAALSRAN